MQTFIIILLGQFVSRVGSRLTSFALNIWIYEQSGSVSQLSLLLLCSSLPSLLISPVTGVFVDRWNRRWTMIIADFCAGLCTLSIAGLFATGNLSIWYLCIAEALSSCFSSCQSAAYAAAITTLVPKEDLTRASGLTSLERSIARLISPVLAGILLVSVQLQGIIMIDFATLFFALVPLLLIRFPNVKVASEETGEKSFLKEAAYGWNYLTTRPGLLGLLFFLTARNIFVGAFILLTTPLVLSFTSTTGLGVIQSITSGGMLVGGLVMSIWKGKERYINTLFGFVVFNGLFILVAALRPSLFLFTVSDFCLFITLPVVPGLVQVIFQKKVPPEVQGRVFGWKDPITSAGLTVGSAIAGPLDENIFEPLMAPDGWLAGNLGQIIGVGTSRGIALLDIVMGLILILGAVAAYQLPRLRLVEVELPDAITDQVDCAVEEALVVADK